ENMALTAGTAYSFYIVVPAATYNDFGVKIYTNKKRNEPSLYKVRTNRPLELQAGMITTIGANFNLITREPVKYKVGDKYPYNAADEDVQGIVFSIDNPDSNMQGLTGRIMALEDCGTADEVYKWGPAIGYALTADSSDGSVNMETVTEAGISNYPAFAACAALTTGGLSWYLPATDELQAIVNNYTKLEITWRAIKNDNTNDMLPAMQYWTSTLGGAKSKVVYYYDFDTETMASERVANLGTAEYAVRAVAKFTSK
ncbi:MAG: DUF1566 domain-containing protein, partial [Alistipes sp.]|nr:DUF1566 domain-containing protein [Alistipes sp.]